MKRRERTLLGALGLGIALAVGLLAQAWAQYPPVTGNVVLAAADATPDLGEEVTLTAAVLDENAEPLAGVECTFSIARQSGDDAAVEAGPFTTDANGNVSTTLDTGSTAGTIVVEANCGELSAQVSLTIACPLGAAGAATFDNAAVVAADVGARFSSVIGAQQQGCPAPTEGPAEPPASLPDTGGGPGSGSAGWPIWALMAGGVVAGLSGLAIARRWVGR